LEISGLFVSRTQPKTFSAHQQRILRPRSIKPSIFFCIMLLAAVLANQHRLLAAESALIQGYVPLPKGSLTFSRDIAPIIYRNCSGCHRPGQNGPFVLLDFASVRKKARLIADVVTSRFMPPWLPEPGYGEFIGERLLSVDDIGRIQQWVAEGTIEGDRTNLPAPPVWAQDWQFGQPDLILTLQQPYELPDSGRDVYRNFVIRAASPVTRYIRAMEFHPGNRAVHHGSMRVDKTPESRQRDDKDPGPGFGGMDMPPTAETPEGHFLSWQPGRGPYVSPPGSAWTLPQRADLVIQLHMKPSGKIELIRPELGLYLTDQPPTNRLFKLLLGSKKIDIPANDSAYVVEDSFRLPVDVQVTGLNPHAHYLGKDLQGFATLPDGTRKWLIWIKDWNFFWQGDYRLKTPLSLPAGTLLNMRYTYDNSERNPQNPNRPSRRVLYGTQTTDEMAELWVQVTSDPGSLDRLSDVYAARVVQDIITASEARLRIDPTDAEAHTRLGSILLTSGPLTEAWNHLCAATNFDPMLDEPHYYLGLFFRKKNQVSAARLEFQKAVQLNPESYKAYGNLGFIAELQGHLAEAEKQFRRVLEIYPQEPLATAALEDLLRAKGKVQAPGPDN
jgi:Flp pilus assembly protein TadD